MSNVIKSCPCTPSCLQRVFTNDFGVVYFNSAVSFMKNSHKSYSILDEDGQELFIINKFKESGVIT